MLRKTMQSDYKSSAINTQSIKARESNRCASDDTSNNSPHMRHINGKNIRPILSDPAPAYTYAYAEPSGPESSPGQCPGGKRHHYSNPLIKQMHYAVIAENIDEPFTAHDTDQWIEKYNIRKGDGTAYKNFKAGSFLSSSHVGKKNKTNRNSVWLDRRFNKSKGVYEYWFVD